MDFINKEKLDQLHEFSMIFPFSRDAVPLLWCRDDDGCILYAPQLAVVSISSQLSTLQIECAKLGLPISISLSTEGLGRSLIDDLELLMGIGSHQTTYSELHDYCLATAGRC